MSPKTHGEIMKFFWIIITSTIFVLQRGSHAKDSEHLKKNSELFCPKGWRPFGLLCYKAFSDWRNFESAEKECNNLGGHLAAITSLEIQEFLTVKILLPLGYKLYIGLLYNDSTKSYNWTDGSQFEFTAWKVYEPSRTETHYKEELCAEMTYNDILDRIGKWNDISCYHEIPYICQKFKDQETEKPGDEPGHCSWTLNDIYFRKSCYHLSLHRKTWEEAEKYCVEQYNGHLAAVTDAGVQKVLFYELTNQQAQQSNVWIGIKLQPDEVDLWTSGWYVGFSNWKNKEVKKGSSKSCAEMTRDGSGEWILSSCDDHLPFICENTTVIPPPKLKPTVPGLKCPSKEWIDLGGDYCYIIDKMAYVSWYYANFLCMRKGGTLVIIHSKEEEDALAQFLRLVQLIVHIGLFRTERNQETSGEFEWVDNSPVTYEHWRPGEPSDKNEVCTEALPNLDMKWNDKKCENNGMFICSVAKKDPTQSTEQTPTGLKQEECECLPTPAIVGVVLCVLVVVILLGVVIYNVKPWKKSGQQECKKRKSSLVRERPRYRTGEMVVSERIYENIEKELYENMEREFQNMTTDKSGRTLSFP